MKHYFSILIMIGLCRISAPAQDLLLLLDGREIPCQLVQTDSFYVEYIPCKNVHFIEKSLVQEVYTDSLLLKDGTIKSVHIELDQIDIHSPYLPYRENRQKIRRTSIYKVFSTTTREVASFTPYEDSLSVFTEERVIYQQDTMVRKYELPENDMRAWVMGRRSARKNFHSPLSTLGGVFTGLAGGLLLNAFYSYVPAIAYTVTNTAIKPKVKITDTEDVPYLQNEYFIEAYRLQSARIKLRNSVIGAVPSLVGGVLIKNFLIP